MKTSFIPAALALATVIALAAILIFVTYAQAGVTCTTYGGKGPGGWRWSQTTCR
jgi:hypothetical protein